MDFAVREVQGGEGGKCLRKVVRVDNFQQQVRTVREQRCYSILHFQIVAGMSYEFDLVLAHHHQEEEECSRSRGSLERCHVKVCLGVLGSCHEGLSCRFGIVPG